MFLYRGTFKAFFKQFMQYIYDLDFSLLNILRVNYTRDREESYDFVFYISLNRGYLLPFGVIICCYDLWFSYDIHVMKCVMLFVYVYGQ